MTGTRLDAYRYLEQEGEVRINQNELFGEPLYNIKYKHQGVSFDNPLVRLARGLVINEKGDMVARGFSKFFNYKQLETYPQYTKRFKERFSRMGDLAEGEKVPAIEKLDGTMIIATLYKGDLLLTTSSTIEDKSGFIAKARQLIEADKHIQNLLGEDHSLIFEYTSPTNRIVIPYEDEELTLLARVDNHEQAVPENFMDGEYKGVKTPQAHMKTLDELIEHQRTSTADEGFVVPNKYGKLIKFKTDYWFETADKQGSIFFGHRLTIKDCMNILRHIREDTIDDLIAIQNSNRTYQNQNRVGRVYQQYLRVVDTLKGMRTYYKNHVVYGDTTDKEFRISLAHNEDMPTVIKSSFFSMLNTRKDPEDILLDDRGSRVLSRYIVERAEQNG